jgi:CBS domain-containing protein
MSHALALAFLHMNIRRPEELQPAASRPSKGDKEAVVQHPYVLSSAYGGIAVDTLRYRTSLSRLKITDPAARAMSDFKQDPPLTITESVLLDEALDDMFRLGVRAFLVVREREVVGLITLEDARAASLPRSASRPDGEPTVAEVMTPSSEVPAIAWQTLQESRVIDLLEIFEATGVAHLVVIEEDAPQGHAVRGIIQRARLERQLGPPALISTESSASPS